MTSGASYGILPARGGIGLKTPHFAELLEAAARGAGPYWAEVHPQNFMTDGGPMHRWLAAVRDALPLSFHSVGLSLGDPEGCRLDELERLAGLVDRYEPAMVSDHLSWSSIDGEYIPDLLPMPMTRASLDHFVDGVQRVQDRLSRTILIENPSRLLAFAADEYDEPSFLNELCRRSGGGLLLDINNLLVTSTNLGLDPADFLDRIDPALVGEIHVAGHTVEEVPGGTCIAIDDHGSPVGELCWNLLLRFQRRAGPRPVLVERDNHIPSFSDLAAEVARADALLAPDVARAA